MTSSISDPTFLEYSLLKPVIKPTYQQVLPVVYSQFHTSSRKKYQIPWLLQQAQKQLHGVPHTYHCSSIDPKSLKQELGHHPCTGKRIKLAFLLNDEYTVSIIKIWYNHNKCDKKRKDNINLIGQLSSHFNAVSFTQNGHLFTSTFTNCFRIRDR